jgi:hypothetical protein
MISLKQRLLKGVYVTGENDWYEVGSKLPIFTPFHKFRILEKRGLISSKPSETLEAQQWEAEEVTEEITVAEESPLEEVEELPLEEEATSEGNAVVDDEVLEEATEDALALEEEAVDPTLETPVSVETPKPKAKRKATPKKAGK